MKSLHISDHFTPVGAYDFQRAFPQWVQHFKIKTKIKQWQRRLSLSCLLNSERSGGTGQREAGLSGVGMVRLQEETCGDFLILDKGAISNPSKKRISCLPLHYWVKKTKKSDSSLSHSDFKRPHARFPILPEPTRALYFQIHQTPNLKGADQMTNKKLNKELKLIKT